MKSEVLGHCTKSLRGWGSWYVGEAYLDSSHRATKLLVRIVPGVAALIH